MNAENVDPSVLKRGVLFALDRDGAKDLFGARGDDALREFVSRLASNASIWSEKLAVDCGEKWQVIDRCLGEMKSEAQLDQCILGGRPMFQGTEMAVILVRPDLVPHLASGLEGVSADALHGALPADQDFADVHATFLQIRQLYRSASEQRAAIVFAVEH